MGGRGRLLVVAAAVAGCGRFGFDPLDGGDASTATDAPTASDVVGELDPQFGESGLVTYTYVDNDGTDKDDKGTAIATDSLGRIVVAASGTYRYYAADDQLDMAAISIRLTPEGSFDATYQYGALGRPGVTVDTSGPWSHATGLIVDGTDRILICGYREWGGTDDPTFLRYLPVAGQPDPAWGTSGISSVAIAGEVQCHACASDSDGDDYIAAGGTSAGAMILARIEADDGSLDTSFAGTGSLVYDVAGSDRAAAVVIDSAGRIYVVGTVNGPADDIAVWRYLPGGVLDSTFSGDGIFRLDLGDVDGAYGAALDAAERLMVVGYRKSPEVDPNHDAVVLRIDPSTGELDPSFAGGVVMLGAPGGTIDEARGVTIDGAGAIWVTGTATAANSSRGLMAIWKLTPGGALDPMFGGREPSPVPGLFLTDVGPTTSDTGWDIAIDRAGKLLVAGETRPAGAFSDVAIWRIR